MWSVELDMGQPGERRLGSEGIFLRQDGSILFFCDINCEVLLNLLPES